MTEWFEEWFGEEYLQLYPHRDDAEAERAVALVLRATGVPAGWRVLDVACGAGRHARAFEAAGARCVGLDLSATLLRIARNGHRRLAGAGRHARAADPSRLHGPHGQPLTSFGYFERDEEHAAALSGMVATLRPGGWFVIDFLNPDAGAPAPGARTR